MKKIVALVLSLVMALSLCAVAFAANTYSDAYEWGTKGWEEYDLDGVTISYTSPTETKKDGKVVAGSLGYYTIDGVEYYVEVAKGDATFQMKVNGKVVYLAVVDVIDYDVVGKAVKAGTKCGDYAKNEVELIDGTFPGYGDATLMEVDGDLYVASNDEDATAVLLDGEVVFAKKAENPVKVPHNWYSVDGKVSIDTEAEALKLAEVKGTVLCKNCNVKATVTNKKADVPVGATCIYSDQLGVYMYWTDGAAGSTTDKDGVESAKTFDAGIAMYVGMSLLSVAGGAVVIGKKKEF